MKKQTIIVLALVMGFALPVLAQSKSKKGEDRIQLAREKYAERLEHIAFVKEYEEDEIPAVNYTTIVRKQNWAGSGQMVDKMEFYYSEIEEDAEPYPVGYTLVMMRRTYNIGSTDYFEEYVYDDEGNPLFWFTRYGYDKDDMVELRGYYNADGTLVQTICKKADKNGDMKTCDLEEDFEMAFADAQTRFGHYKKVFHDLYAIEY